MPSRPKCFNCAGTGKIIFTGGVNKSLKMVKMCSACKGNGIRPATLDDIHDTLLEIKEILETNG